jgi:hypothetical protein
MTAAASDAANSPYVARRTVGDLGGYAAEIPERLEPVVDEPIAAQRYFPRRRRGPGLGCGPTHAVT